MITQYQKYRLLYLASELDHLLWLDTLYECEKIFDNIHNHVLPIRVRI